MKNEIIVLNGITDYNEKFPPREAKKGYIAKINGRVVGPLKYNRDFLGIKAEILSGDEGLYEKQRGDKKGGFTRWYHVVLSHPEHGLVISSDCEQDVPKIAKLLGEGADIHNIVGISNLRKSEKTEGLMVFDALVLTASEAKNTTIESATKECLEIIWVLPLLYQKKVIAELRKKINLAKTE